MEDNVAGGTRTAAQDSNGKSGIGHAWNGNVPFRCRSFVEYGKIAGGHGPSGYLDIGFVCTRRKLHGDFSFAYTDSQHRERILQ